MNTKKKKAIASDGEKYIYLFSFASHCSGGLLFLYCNSAGVCYVQSSAVRLGILT
jgi:hypothetical protein